MAERKVERKYIEDEDGNVCGFTDTKPAVSERCRITVADDYEWSCILRQCGLPVLIKRDIRNFREVPLCNAHAEAKDERQQLPVWEGPVPTLVPVSTYTRPDIKVKLRSLYSKYDETTKRSEKTITTLLRTLTDVLKSKKEEGKQQGLLCEGLKREIEDVRQQLEKCKGERRDLDTREARLRDQVRDLQNTELKMREELKTIRTATDSNTATLRRQTEDIERKLRQCLEEKQAVQNQATAIVNRVRSEQETLRTQMAAAQERIRFFESSAPQIQGLQRTLAETKSERDTLKSRLAELERKCQEVLGQGGAINAQLQRTIEDLQSRGRTIQEYANTCHAERKALQEQLIKAQGEVQSNIVQVRTQLDRCEREKAEIKGNIRELQSHLAAAREEAKSANLRVAQCSAVVDQLHAQLSELHEAKIERPTKPPSKKPRAPKSQASVDNTEATYNAFRQVAIDALQKGAEGFITKPGDVHIPKEYPKKVGEGTAYRYPIFERQWLAPLYHWANTHGRLVQPGSVKQMLYDIGYYARRDPRITEALKEVLRRLPSFQEAKKLDEEAEAEEEEEE